MDPRPPETITFWKKCSVCKKEIGFDQAYQVCDISTCRGKRTGLTFCSIECWDSHLGFAHHRNAFAEERRSPSKAHYLNELRAEHTPPPDVRPNEASGAHRIVRSAPAAKSARIKTDTLVVVSKVKQLIREQAGFNTSQCAIDALTDKVVRECLEGIEGARRAGRKTVMGRDIE